VGAPLLRRALRYHSILTSRVSALAQAGGEADGEPDDEETEPAATRGGESPSLPSSGELPSPCEVAPRALSAGGGVPAGLEAESAAAEALEVEQQELETACDFAMAGARAVVVTPAGACSRRRG
jgi:hypothetical protein